MTALELERFPESQAARRMLERVSPVYKGPVAKWLFEVMGREWDEARAIFGQLPLQAFPETADWGLPYWEQVFQIRPGADATPEERRRMVLLRRDARAPMNPARVAAIVSGMCGRAVDVVEDAAPYTFAVRIKDNDTTLDYEAIRAMLRRIKPSHQQFWLVDQAVPTVLRNRTEVRLKSVGFTLRVSNQPGGEVVLLDGRRRFDGTWYLDQAFRGVELGKLALRFALAERGRAVMGGLALDGMAAHNGERAALPSVSATTAIPNAGRAGYKRLAWSVGVKQKYGLSGSLTRDSMWRFDSAERFDGSRRFDAAIIKEEI